MNFPVYFYWGTSSPESTFLSSTNKRYLIKHLWQGIDFSPQLCHRPFSLLNLSYWEYSLFIRKKIVRGWKRGFWIGLGNHFLRDWCISLYYYSCNLARAIACNKVDGWALRSSPSSSHNHPEIKKLNKKVSNRDPYGRAETGLIVRQRSSCLRGIGIFKVVSLFFCLFNIFIVWIETHF